MAEISIQVPDQLNYSGSRMSMVCNKYKWLRTTSQANKSSSLDINSAGGNDIIFELPPTVMNFAKSWFEFTFTPAAGGATAQWAHSVGLPMVQQIQLYNGANLMLCDSQHTNKYLRLAGLYRVSQEELDTRTGGDGLTTTGLVNSSVFKNKRTSAGGNPRVNYLPTAATIYAGATTGMLDNDMVQYLESGATNQGGNLGPFMRYKVCLSEIKDTILALDKDIPITETLYLRIVFASTNQIIYTTNATNNATSVVSAYTPSITLNDFYLYRAVEDNQEIRNKVMESTMSGLNILFPFVWTFKNNLSGSSQTDIVRLNRNNGRRLLLLYHTLLNATESNNTAYDCSNVAAGKVVNYYTSVNDNRLQDNNISCNLLTRDDYKLHQEMLEGSGIQNIVAYSYNWAHIENFAGSRRLVDIDYSSECGLDLSVEQKYTWAGNEVVSATYNHYTFAVCTRVVNISQSGFVVM